VLVWGACPTSSKSQQQVIQALIVRNWSIRRIARTLGVNRRTVQRYADAAASKCTTKVITGSDAADASKCTTQTPVIAGSRSLCGGFREVIAPMLELGLSAQRIYQDLVAGHGFGESYPSVSRYVAKLKASGPERVWRIECAPGEELQVDFGLGAPLVESGGKTRRTWLFRAVLSHSRKGYSEVVLRQDTETFLRVIENAVRYFGGVPRLLNFDNLKAAVVKADWYDPAMNPKLTDFCRHYGMTPMPCRAYTPQHKGKVERGVGYAKNNALKGRQFASLAEQNAHLRHWEEHVADKRVHGTTRRQVAAVFEEERKALGLLPASVYECYQEGRRQVQRDSFVEVAKAYYEAPPELIGRKVWVRWDGRMVRLFNDRMEQIGAHARLEPGKFSRCLGVRGLHSSVKESAGYWQARAEALGKRPAGGRSAPWIPAFAASWACAHWPENTAPAISMPPAPKPWTPPPGCPPSGRSKTCWRPVPMPPDKSKWNCARPIPSSVRSPPTPITSAAGLPPATTFSHRNQNHWQHPSQPCRQPPLQPHPP
jgi:transposase